MTAADLLQLTIRTPHEEVFGQRVQSVRVPTETGQVGLRPRSESTVLAVEAGVVNVRSAPTELSADTFIGTAGGLLVCQDNSVTLMTPIAVVGDSEQAMVERIEELMQRPNSELEARAAFGKLEGHILSELRLQQSEGATRKLD